MMLESLTPHAVNLTMASGIAVFLALFASLFALQVYRAQGFVVFAGLATAELLKLAYLLTLAGQAVPALAWTGTPSLEFVAHGFLLGLSLHWLIFSFLAFRLPSPKPKPYLRYWLAGTALTFALLFSLALWHNRGLSEWAPAPPTLALLQQIAAGICAGCFLLAALSAAMRWWRSRNGLWPGLAAAALSLTGTTALQFLLPFAALPLTLTLGLASLFIILGLTADRGRFLRLEAELRKSLLENSIKLDELVRSQNATFALMSEAVVHLDLEGRILFANAGFLQLAGVANPQGVNGGLLRDSISAEMYQALQPLLRDLRREHGGQIEIRLPSATDVKVLRAAYAPIRSEAQRIIGMHVGLLEITAYRAAEHALQETVNRQAAELQVLQQSFAQATVAMALTDAAGKIIEVNPASERVFGLSRTELLGRELSLQFEPDSFPATEISRRLSQQQSWHGEVNSAGTNNRKFTCELTAVPLAAGEQQSLRHLWLVHDLTERRQIAEELERRAAAVAALQREFAAQRHYYDAVLDALDDILIIVDAAGRCLHLNAKARLRLGVTAAEMTPAMLPGFFQEIQRLIQYGQSVKIEFQQYEAPVQTRRGETLTCLWNARPLLNPQKEYVGALALGRELAEIERLRRTADTFDLETKTREATAALQRRIDQLGKVVEIGESIRLGVSLEVIMPAVAAAIAALGWQRVAVYQAAGEAEDGDYALAASAGFAENGSRLPRALRKLAHAELAPYLLEQWRVSQSFLLEARQMPEGRPRFLPPELDFPASGDWQKHDCLLVPIRGRERWAGLILVFSPHDGRRPGAEQVHDIERLADDAGLAIANNRLLALHAANVRQAKLLAQIGNAFQAAATLEGVVSEIAGLAAQAWSQPVFLAVRVEAEAKPAEGHNGAEPSASWVMALGQPSRGEKGRGRNLSLSEVPPASFAQLFEQAARERALQVELPEAPWPSLVGANAGTPPTAKLMALRSRGRSFGFLLAFAGEPAAATAADAESFDQDLLAQATLTLDNARLFHQAEAKAHELAHANQHISDFLASVSHELRTPLHAILQFSEILRDQTAKKLAPEQHRQLEIVHRSGRNLLRLIDDILDLSKITAGKMEALREDFDPSLLIREAVETVRPLCEQKKLALRLDLPASLPPLIHSDRNILERGLTNLLGNAVKFTTQGEIAVTAQFHPPLLRLAVRDTGIGIPANRLKEIFEPFRQLETSESRRQGGTGLGLAISQRLLAILGGTITVASTPGEGSTFTLEVPVEVPRTKAGRKARAGRPQTSAKAPAAPPKWRRHRRHILVVEDDENTRYAMQYILEDQGYQVSFAEGGEQALLKAQHERPHLILMDIMMPQMDGYRVARTLKTQKQLAHIPVVALTAAAMKGDREKALAAGCDDYLTKPFAKKDILAMIEKWLESDKR
ncbi:PAS domain-containing protein [bacterium]|nr:PAS domain-containing protein [bacterium]